MGAELCYQGTTLEAAEQVVTWQGQAGAKARIFWGCLRPD